MINFYTLPFVTICFIFIIFATVLINEHHRQNIKYESAIAEIAHDIKNPAFALFNSLNMLLENKFGTLNNEQSEILKLSCATSKYMLNLTGTITSGYEYDYKKLKLNKTTFNIVELINIICAQNEYMFADKGQKVIFNTNTVACDIYADKLQIERVIYNLLSNAITYGFKNSDITLKLDDQEDNFTFSITNMTNPLTDKEIKNIFKKFSKTKNSKKNIYSSGLGLYISKNIIKLHKGKMYMYCAKNGICTFGFTLKKQLNKFHNNNILSSNC